jgi:hypothetical protein
MSTNALIGRERNSSLLIVTGKPWRHWKLLLSYVYTLRLIVYDSFSGVCHWVNTRKLAIHLKFLFNETAMNYGASTHFNTPEYESYMTNRSHRVETYRDVTSVPTFFVRMLGKLPDACIWLDDDLMTTHFKLAEHAQLIIFRPVAWKM